MKETKATRNRMARYSESEKFFELANELIPLGSQTFSKSKTQYPFGVSPFFIERAEGSKVWDIDGNEYIDFVSSLAAITLGYCDRDVNHAVKNQLEKGTIFSLPSKLETEVASLITEMVPSAEMVRFGKNGSDATSGAIRLARAYTGKDHIICCGYHGWHDWYIGSTTKNEGVPGEVSSLTHTFEYNDLDSLAEIISKLDGNVAAVIMEPMNVSHPEADFLKSVQSLCKQNNILFVLDETVTGFRFSKGGAGEFFDLSPDLSTFGKGVANGFPLSVLAGSRKVMGRLEDVFFSFTFGGELLSLAAAKATLEKINNAPVLETISSRGEKLKSGVEELLSKHEMEGLISISGHPSWTFLGFKDYADYSSFQIKTYFLQEVFSRGLLTLGTHNISYSHSDDDVAKTLSIYDEVFPMIKDAVENSSLAEKLSCKPLEPLFKIRKA